jgi:hypothetical protein
MPFLLEVFNTTNSVLAHPGRRAAALPCYTFPIAYKCEMVSDPIYRSFRAIDRLPFLNCLDDPNVLDLSGIDIEGILIEYDQIG